MKRFWPWLLVLLALAPFLLIHAEQGAAPKPVVRHVLAVAVFNNPDSLDPSVGQTLSARLVTDNLFPTLFQIEPNGSIAPGLADSESVNGDTVTLALGRHRLSDGKPLTAQVVAASLSHVLWPTTHSPAAGLLQDIRGAGRVQSGRSKLVSGLVPVGRYTLQIHLKGPDPELLYQLADPFLGIMPVTDLTHGGPYWSVTDLIGSGGYRLASWTPHAAVVLQAVSRDVEPQEVDVDWYPYLGQAALALVDGQVNAVPVAWPALNQMLRSAVYRTDLHLLPDGGQLDLAVFGQVASTWDTAGVASSTFRRVDWGEVLNRAYGPHVTLNRGALAALTAGTGAPTPPASPGAGNAVSGVQGHVSLPALPLDVSTADPLAVRLAHALTAVYPHAFVVTYLSPGALAAAEAAGTAPAVLATMPPGSSWPTGRNAPAVTSLLPAGTFWLLSPGLHGLSTYVDGALDWHGLR
jgi:hypothetical protein